MKCKVKIPRVKVWISPKQHIWQAHDWINTHLSSEHTAWHDRRVEYWAELGCPLEILQCKYHPPYWIIIGKSQLLFFLYHRYPIVHILEQEGKEVQKITINLQNSPKTSIQWTPDSQAAQIYRSNFVSLSILFGKKSFGAKIFGKTFLSQKNIQVEKKVKKN